MSSTPLSAEQSGADTMQSSVASDPDAVRKVKQRTVADFQRTNTVVPIVSKPLLLSQSDQTLTIEGQVYDLPVVVSYDAAGAVSTVTTKDQAGVHNLGEVIASFIPDQRFVWVDECRWVGFLDENLNADDADLCVASGMLNAAEFIVAPLNDGTVIGTGFLTQTLLKEAASDVYGVDRLSKLNRLNAFHGVIPQNLSFYYDSYFGGGLQINLPAAGRHAVNYAAHTRSFRSSRGLETKQVVTEIDSALTVLGAREDGVWETLGTFDVCDVNAANLWTRMLNSRSTLADYLYGEKHNFSIAAIVGRHPKNCDGFSFNSELALGQLPLVKLDKVTEGSTYVAVLHANGRIEEQVGHELQSINIELNPRKGLDPALEPIELIATARKVESSGLEGLVFEEVAEFEQQPDPIDPVDHERMACFGVPVQNQDLQVKSPIRMNAETLLFGRDATTYFGYQGGWWGLEPTGRWIGGTSASLAIHVPATGEDSVAMRVMGRTLDDVSIPLTISYKDKVLFDGLFGRNYPADFNVTDLPRDQMVALTFNTSRDVIRCLAAEGVAHDRRTFAAQLQSVILSTSEDPYDAFWRLEDVMALASNE